MAVRTASGRTRAFDLVVSSSRYGRVAARWLRLLLLLGGDIERNPGPGLARGPLDLSVGFVAATSDRMKKCFSAFQLWCEEEAGLVWESIAIDPQAVALALRGYGLHLFERGHPRYLYTRRLRSRCRPFGRFFQWPGISTRSGRFMNQANAARFSRPSCCKRFVAWQPSGGGIRFWG